MSCYFIAGTGTGVGKTLVTAALCHQTGARALKPVLSGFEAEDAHNDAATLLKSQGLPVNAKSIAAISPWRYAAPLAPPLAAQKEGKTIAFDDIVHFCRTALPPTTNRQPPTLLVESAGGLMSPLARHHTMLDWAMALGWPVILVGGTYLGAVSHMLTALNALQHAPLPVEAIILCESENSPVTLADTAAMLETFVPGHVPVVRIPRLPASAAIWEHVPLIGVCDA